MGIGPIRLDYFARRAILLLNQFDGVETAESCSGHLQEGDQRSDDRIVHYVPGFKHHRRGHRWDDEKKEMVEIPERFEVDGVPVTLADFNGSSYIRKDMLMISPLEEVYEHPHRKLRWTGFHLVFDEFDKRRVGARKLADWLYPLLDRSKGPLDLTRGREERFFTEGVELDSGCGVGEISRLVEIQRRTYEFWREIEELCMENLPAFSGSTWIPAR